MILQLKKTYPILVLLTLLSSTIVYRGAAQTLAYHQNDAKHLLLAEELFNQNLYQAAGYQAQMAQKSHANLATPATLQTAGYVFKNAMATVKVHETNPTSGEITALERGAVPNYQHRLLFAQAQNAFLKNELDEAIPYYEKTSIDHLTNIEIADEKFEMAYAYLITKQFDKAEPLFRSIKELQQGKYYKAGNYYYGLLAYNQHNLTEALKCFELIKNDPAYRAVVPYYIAEIHYFSGQKDTCLKVAQAIVAQKDKSFYDNELHLLIAQCQFEQQNFKEAKVNFEYFFERVEKIRKEDLYKIAYCYYRLNEWKNAIDKFKMLSDTKDSLGQSSMYILGDCYLKTGEGLKAKNAFGICAEQSVNKGQQEASLILHARLSYEYGHNNDALNSIKSLLQLFPTTQYKDEANTLKSALLLHNNAFEEALANLVHVARKDDAYLAVKQKAAYCLAIQQYRKGNFDSAASCIAIALEVPQQAAYHMAATFWAAEIASKRKQYETAISYYDQFISSNVGDKAGVKAISPQATEQNAALGAGYASLEMQGYKEAQRYFNKAQQFRNDDQYTSKIALLQEADAYFLQQNYTKAIALYERIYKTDSSNADYALYQKCILLGLLNKNNEKISALQSLLRIKPPSAYYLTAKYELALTLIDADKNMAALEALKYITDSTSDNNFKSKAWLKTGYIWQEEKQNAKAIEAYKHVVTQYAQSDERSAAMDALRSLFIQNNDPASFGKFLKENNLPTDESTALEATYYLAGENVYASGKWKEAKDAFQNYLIAYPKGIYALKSHYYKAESALQLKLNNEALSDYDSVLHYEWNDFSENSAQKAAILAMNAKNYKAAYNYYNSLKSKVIHPSALYQQALLGMIKSGYLSENYTEIKGLADSLLALPGLSAEQTQETKLIVAKTWQHLGKYDTALVTYAELCDQKSSEIAAESRYRIAEIQLLTDSLTDAEAAANESIKLSGGYDYWVVKSYILLADVFVKQKDYFNAKATLESIIKHAKIAELKQEASKKLTEAKQLEKKASKLKD